MALRLLFASIIMMSLAGSAVATPTEGGAFPSDGLTQPNTVYRNAAVPTNMAGQPGSVDGTGKGAVYGDPVYADPTPIICEPGKYMPANSDTDTCTTPCKANSYCPGATCYKGASVDCGIVSCQSVKFKDEAVCEPIEDCRDNRIALCSLENVANVASMKLDGELVKMGRRSYARWCYRSTSPVGASTYDQCTGNHHCDTPHEYGNCYVLDCEEGYYPWAQDGNSDHATQCPPCTYKITYHANGGTGEQMPDTTCTYNKTQPYCMLRSNTYNRDADNKIFLGWAKSASATIPDFKSSIIHENLTSVCLGTADLYAVWGNCQACAPGEGCDCEFLGMENGVCIYRNAPQKGYDLSANEDEYNPSCTLKSFTCAEGTYLPKDSTVCAACLDGYNCPGCTTTFSKTTDQCIFPCSDGNCGVTCAEGTYLPKNSSTCADCPEDSYCGGGSFTYSSTSDQGISSCSDVTFNYQDSEDCTIANATGATRSYSQTCHRTTSPARSSSASQCTGSANCGTKTYGTCYLGTCNEGYQPNADNTGCEAKPVECDPGYHRNGTECKANTYYVKYNANGGEGSQMPNSTFTYDVNQALRTNTYGSVEKAFYGWATSSNATARTYTDGQSVKNLTTENNGTVNLYALWEDCRACDPGEGATCELIYGTSCVYRTVCKEGYGNLQNAGKYNPYCTPEGVTCSAGKYLPKGTRTCAQCLGGYYCLGGTFPYSETENQGLTSCMQGQTSDPGATSSASCYVPVVPCEAGYYLPTGSTTCEKCPTGTTSNRGENSCHTITVACLAGEYLPKNSDTCADCTAGSYCGGGTFAYSTTSNQGISSCSDVTFNDQGSESCTIANATGATRSYSQTCHRTTSPAGAASASQCTGSANCGTKSYGTCYLGTCNAGYQPNANMTSCDIITYSITYNLNGGTNYAGAPTSYTVETATITLGTPTRNGYSFDGWYTDSSWINKVTQIVKGSTGHKEFWAKWSQGTISCTKGYYLPKNSNTCADCPANSYCEGGSFTYSTTSDQGIASCRDVSFPDSGTEDCTVAHATEASRSYSQTCYRTTSPARSSSASQCTGSANCGTKTYGTCYVNTCEYGYNKISATNATLCNAISVECDEGTYLKKGTIACSICLENHYCAAHAWFTYSTTADQGIAECPSGETSNAGASSCHIITVTCVTGKYLKKATTACSTCPANYYCVGGTFEYSETEDQGIKPCATGYTSEAGAGSCTPKGATCVAGKYLPKNTTECSVCPVDNYCVGGTYEYSASADQGMAKCPSGLVSPQGTVDAGSCGKILHVGDNILYLTSEKQSTPALAARVGGTVYYARTTSGARPMNGTTRKSLRTKIGGIEYSIHDNTAQEE